MTKKEALKLVEHLRSLSIPFSESTEEYQTARSIAFSKEESLYTDDYFGEEEPQYLLSAIIESLAYSYNGDIA